MSAEDIARSTLESLVPPEARPTNARARYDMAVSITLGGVVIVGMIHIAWACGYLTTFGMSGFALANDVQLQGTQLTDIQVNQTLADIRNDKRQVCIAQQQQNQAALTSWDFELQQAERRYQSLLRGSSASVMSCDELLVTTASPK